MDWYLSVILVFLVAGNKDIAAKKHHKHHAKDHHGAHDKIVGGEEVNIEDYPYQAYLLMDDGTDTYECGGSIISSHYILTAAHCLTDIQSISIRIGSSKNFEDGYEYTASSFQQHPNYDPDTDDYDAALVEIADEMQIDGTTTKTIQLADSGTSPDEGTEIKISGWGDTSENGDDSDVLLATTVHVSTEQECSDEYGSDITSRMFCAGEPQGGKDSCQGDSGGPAVDASSDIQVGIVSFGDGCGEPDSPGVYAKVGDPEIRDWISDVTGV